MAESDVPNPNSTLVYFMLATLCFLFFTLFNIFNSKDTNTINQAKNNNIINFIYILLLVVGSYYINANVSKAMCGSQSVQWNYVMMATLLPWVIIFLTLYFILGIFPGWISPFSNTVGYMFISILGLEGTLKKIIKTYDEAKPKGDNDLIKAINNIDNNKAKFVNQINIDQSNFEQFIKLMQKNQLLKDDLPPADSLVNDENILNLYKLLTIKHIIGQVVWYILAGILISSVSYNYIINISCEKSLEEIKANYEKMSKENQ